MPFAIYTYADPYSVGKTALWKQKIQKWPHLCSSQVMVNGFRDLYDDEFESLLCPIENVLRQVYPNWQDNVERRIEQHIAVSRELVIWRDADPLAREPLYQALKHGQSSMIDALRIFLELGIKSGDIDTHQANEEQVVFVDLLEKACDQASRLGGCFHIDDELLQDPATAKDQLVAKFSAVIHKEIIEEEKKFNGAVGVESEKRNRIITRYKALLHTFTKDSLQKVVVHGIHQFSPLQLRFLCMLDRIGVDVIFLYNRQEKYAEIYSTWDDVYSLFGTARTHIGDSIYKCPFPSSSYELANALGRLASADRLMATDREAMAQTAADVELLRFENITEYASFVSVHFNKALYEKEKEDTKNGPTGIAANSYMNELVYSAGREVHELLRAYYPDHSGDLHFLHYPIGRFFLGLYSMWDGKAIKLDWSNIKECFNTSLLGSSNGQLNDILENSIEFFRGVQTFSDYQSRMAQYKNCFKAITDPQSDLEKRLRYISFYNNTLLTSADIEKLDQAILTLNDLACALFEEDDTGNISFDEHFKKLEAYLRSELPNLADIDEVNLAKSILERFETVGRGEGLAGTINDLMESLRYFLRQNDRENPDWIVKNFEQIEGDVLLSRRQHKQGLQKVYHFACLSDSKLVKGSEGLLPWPITDAFVKQAYSPVSLEFQAYFTSLCDRSRFMRYALFYGLYYNRCGVRLSYVASTGDHPDQLYSLLNMLGLKPKVQTTDLEYQPTDPQSSDETRPCGLLIPNGDYPRMDFLLCPYKYFLDFVCRNGIIADNRFLIDEVLFNLIISMVWPSLSGLPLLDTWQINLRDRIKEAINNLEVYIPFLRTANDIKDLHSRVYNYFLHQGISENGKCYKAYDPQYMEARLLFRKLNFSIEDSWSHPYSEPHNRLKPPDGNSNRILSLKYRNTFKNNIALRHDLTNYLNDPETKPVAGQWCSYCSHKDLCLHTYRINIDQPEDTDE